MKKIKLLMLIMTVCVSSFCSIAQNKNIVPKSNLEIPHSKLDSLEIPPKQVIEVYKGLKQNEELKTDLSECKEIANSLNVIVQQQNDDLSKSLNKLTKTNSELKNSKDDLLKANIKLQTFENRKTPFYKQPLVYLGIGFLGGIYLMK